MRKFLILLVFLVSLLLLGAPVIRAQEATATPDVGWPIVEQCKDSVPDARTDTIAFVSDQAGIQQIYTMDVDGNHQQKISKLVDANISNLDWSPDGKQMAFTNNSHIYRLNIELKAATQLTANPRGDYHPAWSPDGRHIAYISTRGGPYDIWLMKPNGSNIGLMTNDPRWELTVRWSPDSKSYGYVPNSGANLQLWIEDEKSAEIFMQFASEMALHTITDFRWSPNGHYFSLQTDYGASIINRDGTDLRQIADRDLYVYEGAPSWSPDSCHLIYGLNQNDKSEIYIMDLYDGNSHKIAEGRDPVWKP